MASFGLILKALTNCDGCFRDPPGRLQNAAEIVVGLEVARGSSAIASRYFCSASLDPATDLKHARQGLRGRPGPCSSTGIDAGCGS